MLRFCSTQDSTHKCRTVSNVNIFFFLQQIVLPQFKAWSASSLYRRMFVSSGDLKIPENYSLKLVAQNISRMNLYVILGFGQSVSRRLLFAAHGFNWANLGYLNSFLWRLLFVCFNWLFGVPWSMVAHALDEHDFSSSEEMSLERHMACPYLNLFTWCNHNQI